MYYFDKNFKVNHKHMKNPSNHKVNLFVVMLAR